MVMDSYTIRLLGGAQFTLCRRLRVSPERQGHSYTKHRDKSDLTAWKYLFNPLFNLLYNNDKHLFSRMSVQLLSCVQLFVTPWTAARQAFLSITNSWSLLKLMSIKSVMPSRHLILCHPLLLLPSIFPSIRVFPFRVFPESVLPIRWPKYWSFSFSISPSNGYSGLISFRVD